MELEISPAPSETEQAAITAAFEEIEAEAHKAHGAWWQAGVRENLDDDPDS